VAGDSEEFNRLHRLAKISVNSSHIAQQASSQCSVSALLGDLDTQREIGLRFLVPTNVISDPPSHGTQIGYSR
jgi:hypothetical protein